MPLVLLVSAPNPLILLICINVFPETLPLTNNRSVGLLLS